MTRRFICILFVASLAGTSIAQPRGGFGPPPGGPGGGPPSFPLLTALDVNKDGKLSKKEVENAVAALKKLDKDKNGKLTREEIGWPPQGGFGGPGGPPGRRGFFGGGFPGFGGGDDRRGRPGPDGGPAEPRVRRASIFDPKQLARMDRNKDKKITKNEIPQFLQKRVFDRLDKNKDGIIDQAELKASGKQESKNQEDKR